MLQFSTNYNIPTISDHTNECACELKYQSEQEIVGGCLGDRGCLYVGGWCCSSKNLNPHVRR